MFSFGQASHWIQTVSHWAHLPALFARWQVFLGPFLSSSWKTRIFFHWPPHKASRSRAMIWSYYRIVKPWNGLKDLKAHLLPTLCHGQSCHPPDQSAQGVIQLGLAHLQEWDVHNFFRHSVQIYYQCLHVAFHRELYRSGSILKIKCNQILNGQHCIHKIVIFSFCYCCNL